MKHSMNFLGRKRVVFLLMMDLENAYNKVN
jgi:hypothetical protein